MMVIIVMSVKVGIIKAWIKLSLKRKDFCETQIRLISRLWTLTLSIDTHAADAREV